MIIDIAVTALLFFTFIAFAGKRGLTYMHIYQQEEYDSPRFLKWIIANRVFDKRLSLLVIACSVLAMFIPALYVNAALFVVFAVVTYSEKDPRKDSKKKLAFTARTKRIFFPATLITALGAVWCFFIGASPLIWIINIQLIPLMIVIVNSALQPLEQATQNKFWQEAHNKVMDYQPKTIAITGSFGKTSVKHILGHILKMHAPTLITPGSVNTPMGITRIIREQLEPEHKFFVVEMGAYGPGSIAGLCKLTPPDIGIITAIGHAHYERFKTLETVAEAKYELAQSALRKEDGLVIAHERTLRFEHAQKMREEFAEQFIVCGEKEAELAGQPSFLKDGDLEVTKIDQLPNGLSVKFSWKDEDHKITAPLYGLHHGHNLVLAFVTALHLGIDAKDIQTALKTMPQIQHRLEVKPQENGTVIIDDAYNSNPIGFRSALELLAILGKKGRKILITPGMVEMGNAHAEAHDKIGRFAGQVCDVVVVVQGQRIPSFVDGYRAAGSNKIVVEVRSFAEAQSWMSNNHQKGDVILVENDLPDLYERVPKL
jgi:UDP-N-acetylmuramoyl-tripeptide--D-alanyl-D-alanine ligase